MQEEDGAYVFIFVPLPVPVPLPGIMDWFR